MRRTPVDDSVVWYYARSSGGSAASNLGRYSPVTEKTWYAASDPKTAAVEALRGLTSGTVDIFEEHLSHPFLVLDFRERACCDYPFSNRYMQNLVALGYLSEAAPFGLSGEPEYRVPQLVAHWARQCGIQGILYTSTRFSPYGSAVGGDCLAIFETSKVLNQELLGTFQFSDGPVDINFPEDAWRLVPSARAEKVMEPGGVH